jgi:hypothetical protein
MPKGSNPIIADPSKKPMWLVYQVQLRMTGRFAASLPRTMEEIKKMLENRMPANPPADYVPIEELADQVAEKVGAPAEGEEEEEFKFGWATFARNDDGLYYEGRCVRGHIKDCATQVSGLFEPKITALKAKVANKVYVMTDVIPLLMGGPLVRAKEIAGTEQRFVQVMTRMGPRSTIKYIDYLNSPTLSFHFQLNVLNDGVITEEILHTLFEYGSIHGMGQERSTGWGRYSFTIGGK